MAQARAQNWATESSSARAVGATPAHASTGPTASPSDFRLVRNILRRWPNAAAVMRSSAGRRAGASGSARGRIATTLDVTVGGGTKARGGTSNRIFTSASHCARTERRPYDLLHGKAV